MADLKKEPLAQSPKRIIIMNRHRINSQLKEIFQTVLRHLTQWVLGKLLNRRLALNKILNKKAFYGNSKGEK